MTDKERYAIKVILRDTWLGKDDSIIRQLISDYKNEISNELYVLAQIQRDKSTI